MARNEVAFHFGTTVAGPWGPMGRLFPGIVGRRSTRGITGKLLLIAVAVMTVASIAACSGSSGTSLLTSKRWQLIAITEKVPAFQGVIPAADQPKYEVMFHDDGKLSGTADCNQFAGEYKTPGSDGLTITIGAGTLAFCPEGSFADLFIHGLSRAKSYRAAEHLTITLDDSGTLEFALAAAGASPSASSSAGAVAS